MAKIFDITDTAAYAEWVAGKPPVVQELVKRFPPNLLYRLKATNKRVTMHGYSEDGTLIVLVSGKYNRIVFEHIVFDVKPDTIEECDLPAPSESLGTVLTEEAEVLAYIALLSQEEPPTSTVH